MAAAGAQLENSMLNSYISSDVYNESLTIRRDIEDSVNNCSEIPVMHAFTMISPNDHSTSANPYHLKLEDSSSSFNMIDKNATKVNLNHHKCMSQDKITESNVALMPTRKNIYHKSSSALCCKVSIIFGVCFIIGCYLIPVTLYYVGKSMDHDEMDPMFLHQKNTSAAKIKLTEVCNFSTSGCVEQILGTYEALRTVNLPSSQLYCADRVEALFCNALMECGNESHLKDIMCQQVRQEYCTAEWRLLEVHNQTDQLIDCEEYKETAPLNCGDQFGVINDGSVCLPLCEEFSQYSEAYTTPHIVLTATASSLAVIGGIIVILVSFKKRKTMFCFPQVLVVINAGVLAFIYFIELISILSIGRWNILCSKQFVFDALEHPTAFCTVQGSVIISGVVIYGYFWLLYVCHLALKVFYPLKSTKLFASDYSRIIYIAEILIILIVGTLPAIVLATGSNYRIISFPPIFCGVDLTYRTYVLLIPVLVIDGTMMILMSLVVYRLHIHYGIFKSEQQESVRKQVFACQFTVPEVKIVFVLLYWLFCTILVWTNFSISDGREDIIKKIFQSYVGCMAGGNRKDHDCNELREDLEAETYPALEVAYLISVAFLNFVSLPLVVQFYAVKEFARQTAKKLKLCK